MMDLHMKYDPCRNDKSRNNLKASTGLKVLWFVWNTDLYENGGYSFRHLCFWSKMVSKRVIPHPSLMIGPQLAVKGTSLWRLFNRGWYLSSSLSLSEAAEERCSAVFQQHI